MKQRAIPVIVLSGFLGSGKTTLLLRLLRHAHTSGLRASVLMNEIGAVDVDGTQVSRESAYALMERITEGCLCCSKKSELAGCLERLALMRPDVIVMELTGVANPEEIVEAMTEPEVIGKVALHRIVTVLDAEHALDYNSIFSADRELIRTLRRQLEVADVIVANKFDLISDRTADKVRSLARDRNPAAAFVSAVRCDIDPAGVFAGIVPAGELRPPGVPAARPSGAAVRPAGASAAGGSPAGG
ncbi:GTP-binding protein, partial [Paenibacillus sp. GCM10023250]|uniref:GTP-binding protein n=1 Tax=Paenibacillus sp. GCM10023250 TaxID=3252648 RepID=UPI0036135BE4